MIIAGFNPVYTDLVCSKHIMGFKWQGIKTITKSLVTKGWPLVDNNGNVASIKVKTNAKKDRLNRKFRPPFNWRKVLI